MTTREEENQPYKMRILQDYLSKMTPEEILKESILKINIQHKVMLGENMNSTTCFTFEFPLLVRN